MKTAGKLIKPKPGMPMQLDTTHEAGRPPRFLDPPGEVL